jgi:Acetyltransferase (GNAT) domain
MSGSVVPGTNSAEAARFVPVDDVAGLLSDARDDLFASLAWYRTVLDCGMADRGDARFLLTGSSVFPMQVVDGRRSLASLTTLYSCRWRPVVSDGSAFAAFARVCRGWPLTRLDALPVDWPHRVACADAARAAGLAVRQFDHFGNWHEDVRGQTWHDYLAGRPGQLRETIRRKLRRECKFELIEGGDGLEAGIAAFEAVYRRSWKEPEPFPEFNASLMRAIAPLGLLRLGVLSIGDVVVAAQIWVVERERATVLKLAHDEAFKPASPGTVLTALMLRRLLDEEQVPEIDFGRGDDGYKSAWARQRRQRIGLMFANPLHPRGMAFLGRHALGRVRAALLGSAALGPRLRGDDETSELRG